MVAAERNVSATGTPHSGVIADTIMLVGACVTSNHTRRDRLLPAAAAGALCVDAAAPRHPLLPLLIPRSASASARVDFCVNTTRGSARNARTRLLLRTDRQKNTTTRAGCLFNTFSGTSGETANRRHSSSRQTLLVAVLTGETELSGTGIELVA